MDETDETSRSSRYPNARGFAQDLKDVGSIGLSIFEVVAGIGSVITSICDFSDNRADRDEKE